MKRKMSSCFYFTTTIAKWIQGILKIVLNLCSRKQLRPSRDVISYLMPLRLWQLNRLLGDNLTNCSKAVELCISISKLFHSRITETAKSETKIYWVWLGFSKVTKVGKKCIMKIWKSLLINSLEAYSVVILNWNNQ